MKTFAFLESRRCAVGFAIAALLVMLSGCTYVHNSSSSSSSLSDAKAITNRTVSAEIPAGLKSLEVDNHLGAVHVVASESGAFKWTWKLAAGAATDDLAAQAANAASCQAVLDGDTMHLLVSLPDKLNGVSFQSDLEIQVPKPSAVAVHNSFGPVTISACAGNVQVANQNATVDLRDLGGRVHAETSFASLALDGSAGPAWLKDQNGRLDVANVRGPLEAETSFSPLSAHDIGGPVKLRDQNGRVEVRGVKGTADVKTSFASLEVEDIDGAVTLANQNGSLSAKDVKGAADLTTSFAELRAEGIAGAVSLENQNGRVSVSHVSGSVRARTSFAEMDIEASGRTFDCRDQNGALRLHVLSSDVAAVEAETSFASLEVYLPEGLKPAIQARTSFADVESDFPVLMKPRGENPFDGLDASTPRLSLQNQNGRIRVTSQKSVAER